MTRTRFPAVWPKLECARKIAVLRPNSLGDYIFAIPALESLRRAYPYAEIVLLGKPWHREFLAGRPGPVDRVIALPQVNGVCDLNAPEDPVSVDKFISSVRSERFDICVQMYGGGRFSNPFAARLGARLTVGMKAEDADASGLDRWIPYLYYFPEVQRYLELVGLAGAEPAVTRPFLTVTERDTGETENLAGKEGRIAVLHPGAADTRRQWPAEKFGRVGGELAENGCRVFITGSGGEKDICASVEENMSGRAENLCGKLSLGGLTGLLSMAAVLVSNDTGPLHLARAVGTPTVGLYWIGNLINAGPPDMTFHRAHFSWNLKCPECGTDCIKGSCVHRPSFISDIPVSPVAASALGLLRHSIPRPAVLPDRPRRKTSI